MITLTLTEDQAHSIRYALSELANRRQEQAVDSRSLKEAASALYDEARQLRALQDRISKALLSHEQHP